jgi:hypothetical protein
VVAGCAANGAPGASGSAAPTPTHTPAPPLEPQSPATRSSTLAWLFTPIFQAMFIVLVGVYDFSARSARRRPSRGRSSP